MRWHDQARGCGLWQNTLRSGSCSGSITATWRFVYDGDGNRVEQVYTGGVYAPAANVKVSYYYSGGAYEVDGAGVVQSDGTITISSTATVKYYTFGGMAIAMDDVYGLKYFLTDHLGSTVAVLSASGALVSQQRYLPFGQWVG